MSAPWLASAFSVWMTPPVVLSLAQFCGRSLAVAVDKRAASRLLGARRVTTAVAHAYRGAAILLSPLGIEWLSAAIPGQFSGSLAS